MEQLEDIKEHLEHISQEVAQLRKLIIYQGIRNKEKTEAAWKSLMKASEKISKIWKGSSVIDEIRDQRNKKW